MKVFWLVMGFMLFPDSPVTVPDAQASVRRDIDRIVDGWHERIEARVLTQSQRLWDAPRNLTDSERAALVQGELQSFIDWLEQEIGEAFQPAEVDKAKLVAAAQLVFTHACNHDRTAYALAWGDFLAIVLKYCADLGCSAYPATAPYAIACQFAGHLVGKYGGQLLGTCIHDAACSAGRDWKDVEREIKRAGREARRYNWHLDPGYVLPR